MEEQLIDLYTAKLAYEKGFRKRGNMMGWVTKFYRASTGTLVGLGRQGKTKISEMYYAAPQSVLQKWLREEHKIYLSVSTQTDTNGAIYFITTIPQYQSDFFVYNTWEEALEKGLVKALNLIK